MIVVFGIIYAVASFLLGIMEARTAGFFFSLGIIVAGIAINDFATFISGVIAFVAVTLSLVAKRD